MKRFYKYLLIFCSFSLWSLPYSYSMDEVQYEQSYTQLAQRLNTSAFGVFSAAGPEEGKVLIDVLWDKLAEKSQLERIELKTVLGQISARGLDVEDQFRLYLMKKRLGLTQVSDQSFLNSFYKELIKGKASRRAIHLYYSYGQEAFNDIDIKMLNQKYPKTMKDISASHASFRPKTKRELQDLVFRNPVSPNYKNGVYQNSPQLFMFCRHNRRYHCLMIMKDSSGDIVRDDNGEIWSQHKLGLARRSVPYNKRNGYTPSGVYTIDSVMPYADQQRTYGEFRRLIINFISPSQNESSIKEFLPESAHNKAWWNEGVVARDIGRNLLRVHGSGRKNWNPFARHYPFVKTSGCIMSREGRYGGTVFKDQRYLLDEIMLADQLEPRYENEPEIKGLLYLIEVSDEHEHIYLPEIEWYLGLR